MRRRGKDMADSARRPACGGVLRALPRRRR